MGDLGRTSILGQKQLRGKTVKSRHGRQYKKGLSCAQQGQGRRTEEGGRKTWRDKTREKQVRKGVKDKRENRKLRKEKGTRKEKQRVSKSVMVGMNQ